MTTLIDANNEFSMDLFKKIMKEYHRENIFISPLSASAGLAMVLLGAAGDTAKQMEKVLHFNEITGSGGPKDLPVSGTQCDKPGGPQAQFKALLSAINHHTKNYALSVASRLYGSDQYEFHQQYLQCTKELYNAELERVDFLHAAEEARKKINSWVESQTNGKIKDLFPSKSLDPSAILVLVNAIYFKGKWQLKFKEDYTHEAPFYTDQTHSKNVQMMFQQGKFKLAKITNPAMQILELPYDNDELSMIILLPDVKGPLCQLQRELTYAKLKEWTSSANMRQQTVRLFLPKFKLEEKYELIEALSDLGITDLFTRGKADLSGMSGSPDLVVSTVIQKSYIEVTEEGTEAAAATGVEIVPTSMPLLLEFRADHSFLFFIRDNKTGCFPFSGKYFSPQ
ncbi:serpin B11-like isoform X2 [Elgaria multicarinata webbii]|uniref:serpin B11-like isoform X2 n=1 Tax=Elgaria multicarinata webbii TaxID=159646 RepID=UPI002FCD38DA